MFLLGFGNFNVLEIVRLSYLGQHKTQLVLCFLEVLPRPHATNEITCFGVLVAVDTEQLLLVHGCKHLAESRLATACFSDKEAWLVGSQALVH